MRKFQIFIIIALLLNSCTFENDLFEAFKEGPRLSLHYQGQTLDEISDSLKVQVAEIGRKQIVFEITISDKSRELDFHYEFLQGAGIVNVNNQAIEANSLHELPRGKHAVSFIPERSGRHVLNFFISDLYGNVTYRKIEFFIFSNLAPVARLSITQLGQFSRFEIEIDASSSFDQDERWGGKIQEYIFRVGSFYQFNTNQFKSIKHVLPGPGTFVISLQVRDNDGTLSEPVFQTVTL